MLYLKIFLRKRDTVQSIVAISLLIAILASAFSIISFLNAQIETLAALRTSIGKYIVAGSGESISDSRLDPKIADNLRSLPLDNVMLERLFWSNITFDSGHMAALVRGVDDIEKFLGARKAYLNGSVAKSLYEAVIGELAANAYSISIGAEIRLAYNAKSIKFTIVGVFRTGTEIDSEIVVPMEAAFNLTGEEHISLIEFSLKKGAGAEKVLAELSRLLPEDARVIQVQQPTLFAQQTVIQTLKFLDFWSLAIYAVVASASYVIATRLIDESKYEIQMLRVLGVRRIRLFVLILLYMAIVASTGFILGAALGLVGAQVISAALSWLAPGLRITPLLEPSQLLRILSITVSSATIGCLYPASKVAKVKHIEKLL